MSERDAYHKGWCPSIAKPMESGDGLLVRLNIADDFIEAATARAFAQLAAQYGNRHIDLTSRGNLQIRGVTPENYEPLFEALTALGLREEERKARAEQPGHLPALGYKDGTLTLGLLFGRTNAEALAWLADQSREGKIMLSTTRIMRLNNIPAEDADALLAEAARMGFITETNDSRRAIEACPGAPACASAQGTTRDLALAIAAALPGLAESEHTIHVSGCIKGCACANPASRVVTARFGGYALAMDAKADDMPLLSGLSAESIIRVLTEWETP